MNQVSRVHLNAVLALAVVAILMIAPFTFLPAQAGAQSTNYYNSINPNPTANPSITNTIIPGAANVPTGNSNTTIVAGVPNTGGVSNPSTATTPAVPNTGGVQGGSDMSAAPGVPNTGAGGNADTTLLAMGFSALLAAIGIGSLIVNRKRPI